MILSGIDILKSALVGKYIEVYEASYKYTNATNGESYNRLVYDKIEHSYNSMPQFFIISDLVQKKTHARISDVKIQHEVDGDLYIIIFEDVICSHGIETPYIYMGLADKLNIIDRI